MFEIFRPKSFWGLKIPIRLVPVKLFNPERIASLLATRIKDAQIREQEASIAAQRKSLVGSGDRSEKK